jgi:ABC-type antimicrobial peptide transport system permease subunit
VRRAHGVRVVGRDEVRALVAQRVHLREGVFAVHMVLAFALGVPLLLATTGMGLSERRRETGLLRALGWRRDEVVLRSLVESLTLAAAATAASVLVVWAWVRVLGGAGVARLFLPDADVVPGFDVPFRLLPGPLVAAAAVAGLVTAAGSLLSSWRAASAAPAEAVR